MPMPNTSSTGQYRTMTFDNLLIPQSPSCPDQPIRRQCLHLHVLLCRSVQLYPIRPGGHLANVSLAQCQTKDELTSSTEHTGIACFTVRHKDENGQWVENEESKKKQ
jgi:hypothetical protein